MQLAIVNLRRLPKFSEKLRSRCPQRERFASPGVVIGRQTRRRCGTGLGLSSWLKSDDASGYENGSDCGYCQNLAPCHFGDV
jgi:hypothetical protein